MAEHLNHLGQPVGIPVENWRERPPPPKSRMSGRYCRVAPIDLQLHAAELHQAYLKDLEHRIWTYLGYGPFDTLEDFKAWMKAYCLGSDPLFHAIIENESSMALGVASYMRIQPEFGVIEVGHINYSPALQRKRASTEAMYLMMQRVFDELGYRRYEWKCDALNATSRKAAERLGFTFEGVFRQATIYKERNRDTAWYSIVDTEWPALKNAFQCWLNRENFDSHGRQKQRLSEFQTHR